jgi:DPCD protein family
LYPNQSELIEELDVNSNEVLGKILCIKLSTVRKWKHPKEFGEGQWEYEIGEAPKVFNPEADLLAPSGDNVMLSLLIYNLADLH